jgi:DNA-3-methyladenine glycosylase II
MAARPLSQSSLGDAARYLAARDEDLATIFSRYGPPPLWARRPGFPTLVRIILEQQVSLASAQALYRRLQTASGSLRPHKLLAIGETGLRGLGVTRQKSAYLLHLAAAITQGKLSLAAVSGMSDTDARACLMQVKGIGPWTADIYLLMALRRPDVWPESDLALVSIVTEVKQLPARPRPEQLASIASGWQPYRSVAARMFWQHYLAGARRGLRQATAFAD